MDEDNEQNNASSILSANLSCDVQKFIEQSKLVGGSLPSLSKLDANLSTLADTDALEIINQTENQADVQLEPQSNNGLFTEDSSSICSVTADCNPQQDQQNTELQQDAMIITDLSQLCSDTVQVSSAVRNTQNNDEYQQSAESVCDPLHVNVQTDQVASEATVDIQNNAIDQVMPQALTDIDNNETVENAEADQIISMAVTDTQNNETDQVLSLDAADTQNNETDQILSLAVADNQDTGGDVVANDQDEPMDSLEDTYSYPSIRYDFSSSPQQVTSVHKEFQSTSSNFLKGCKWSPDGACLLTNSDDNILRLFNLPSELYSGTLTDQLPEMSSVLQMSEGETVYDYSWYPFMNSSQPETCCLVSTSRDHPVHLWDAFTGKLRCSYRPYNHMDEIVAATSVAFNLDGSRIFCGFNKTIKVFDTNRPGRDCVSKPTTVKKKRGQTGIISSIAFSPDSDIYALGSFSKSVGVYDESNYSLVCLLQGQGEGSHTLSSHLMVYDFSVVGKDEEILCWDLRNPGSVLYRMLRHVDTNQRIYFDLDSTGQYLVSGGQSGIISVWDTYCSPEATMETGGPTLLPALTFSGHNDCVNGISFHPSLPLLASASGQRKFPLPGGKESDDEDNMEDDDSELSQENSVHLWSIPELPDINS